MQAELDAEGGIDIVGINTLGSESGVQEMCDGRVLRLLQDTPAEHVWTQWQVDYRDVVILDKDNVPVGIYNLTVNDLSIPANYDGLKDMLRAAR